MSADNPLWGARPSTVSIAASWVHIAVTNSPTADWIARQITEAFPWDAAPGYLIRDRDCVSWLDRKAARLRDGHPGQTDRAPLTMAERFGRAPDWVHPSRMPGPDHCLRRGASAPDSALLRELLQQSSDAPVTQQRRAGASSDSAPWRPKVISCSRWTTSPIRPNLVFGTDRPSSPKRSKDNQNQVRAKGCRSRGSIAFGSFKSSAPWPK